MRTPRRRSPIWLLACAALLAAATALGCQLVAGLTEPSRPALDAGPDTSPPPAPFLAGLGCDDSVLKQPPQVPSTHPDITIDLAVSYLTGASRPTDAGVDLCPVSGFDLDQKKTCLGPNGEPRSLDECPGDKVACEWGPSCSGPGTKVLCDQPLGVDNALAEASLQILKLSANVPSLERSLDPNVGLHNGTANVLIRIADYNGEAYDDSVSVAFFVSSGLASSITILDDDDGGSRERWDGRALREWQIDDSSVVSGELVSQYRGVGFVAGHVLVLPNFEKMPLPVVETGLVLERARLTGLLVQTDGSWQLVRGRVGGSMLLDPLLSTVGSLQLTRGGQQSVVCNDGTIMAFLTNNLCSLADLPDEPGGRCARVSIGLSLTAVPAVFGKVVHTNRVVSCDARCP